MAICPRMRVLLEIDDLPSLPLSDANGDSEPLEEVTLSHWKRFHPIEPIIASSSLRQG